MAAGVYLHIPFCKSRCSYCDFATDVYRDSGAVERYVEALCREIALYRTTTPSAEAATTPPEQGGEPFIDTIYFGGGTPSLLTPEQVERIMAVARTGFD